MFAYELPKPQNSIKKKEGFLSDKLNTTLVYNYHSLNNQQRIFVFVNQSLNDLNKKNKTHFSMLNSVAEIFPNANWLEREISELHGVSFFGKKDLRNLMLQYGDTTAPMLKSFPSIGTREIFYDSVSDMLVQSATTLQF